MAPQQPDRTAGPYEPDDIGVTGVTTEIAVVTVDGGGEVRAAERAAERAAALAVTEGFHPLRVRPYVGDPGDTADGTDTTVRPLIDVAGEGEGGPATTDLGLFPAEYAAMAAAQEYPLEYPPDDDIREAAAAAAHGRHRRRRRGIVVTAAAVAASALAAGAVAVTGSVMGDEPRGTDRALPEPASAAPDVTLPADAAPGAAVTQPVRVTHYPMRATTSPAPKPAPSAPVTPLAVAAAPAAATTAPPAPSTPATPPQSTPPPVTATAPPAPPTTPAPPAVLQLGASGAAVTDLQQRLTEVWVYRGAIDGRYDMGVEQAVAVFQIWYGVRGDPSGVYGQATHTALVRATSPSGNPHHSH
ncbi:peptidoglycan-binding domain-containing protein [Streptomyces sp. NBC_01477]|uniref:peptidoglycan-binding domain-containing protein n=1 Tax=Streptomyces sp. NBC_01477 TaxID=2976015 RepID=UPI002E371A26|nr:peptidoglycan-binding domain-containing protein [Streptomyces sp. NBC_01477]